MKTRSELLAELWIESRTRFTNLLKALKEEDLAKKLPPSPNSIGFLIRHMGDVEFLFAKNVFGNTELKVSAKTVMAQHDSGEWIHLNDLLEYCQQSFEALHAIVVKQTDENWEEIISTKEFGTKSKAEAFGRIISHTAYHAGQLALVLKYGA
jgi:uncharacterized damage-inducible protein DinB